MGSILYISAVNDARVFLFIAMKRFSTILICSLSSEIEGPIKHSKVIQVHFGIKAECLYFWLGFIIPI